MLFWTRDLVHGVVLEGVEVFVTLVAVFVFISVLLMILHDLLRLERHVTVFVGTFDASDWLKCGWHLGFVVVLDSRELVGVVLGATSLTRFYYVRSQSQGNQKPQH